MDRPLGIKDALEETYLKTSTTQEKFSVVFPKFFDFIVDFLGIENQPVISPGSSSEVRVLVVFPSSALTG